MPVKRKVKKENTTQKIASIPVAETAFPQSATSSGFAEPKISLIASLRRPPVIILIVLIILGIVFYAFRKWFVVAEVNGQPISRAEYSHQLDIQSGDQVLNELIAKTLILQEANNKHITVSQSDINNRINMLQSSLTKQGQTLDQYLTVNKKTKQDLYDEVKIQEILEKLLAKQIQVSDSEVNNYIDQNKDSIPATAKPADIKAQVKQQLAQQKLQEKLPAFIQDLQKKAKISRFISY